MKNQHRLLSLLLAAVLLVGIFATGAYAWSYISESITCKLNESLWYVIDTPNGEGVEEYALESGKLPAGLSIGENFACIIVCGTPTESGIFNATVSMRTQSVDYMVELTITVTQVKTLAINNQVSGTVGVPMNIYTRDTSDMIHNWTQTSGSIPAGLSVTCYDTYFAVTGTPTKAGNYSVSYDLETEGNPIRYNIIFTIAESTKLEITKSPSGETVTVGDSASFISAANNYSKLEWRVVTPDGSNCWHGKSEIESGFPGVKFSTYNDKNGREWLTLSNIPLSMNGYYIQTKFWSLDQSETAFTTEKSCRLTVKEPVLQAPVITFESGNVSISSDKSITLSISANDPNQGVLSYQWYYNSTPGETGASVLYGASSPSYTPNQTTGTGYYFVVVKSTKDGYVSPETHSRIMTVTVTAPAVTTPPVTPEPVSVVTPVPVTPAPAAITPSPAPAATVRNGISLWLIIALLCVLLAAAIVVILLLALKKRPDRDEAPTTPAAPAVAAPAAVRWFCPECGARNSGKFCSKCGTRFPSDEL